MRVDVRRAVAGEVLDCGQHAGILEAVDVRRHHVGDEVGVFAERAGIDDRVARVGVEVGDGSVHLRDTEGACLAARHVAGGVGVLRIAGRAEGHGRRKGRRPVQAHAGAPFHVLPDQERHGCTCLEILRQHGLAERVALKKHEAADFEALDEVYDVAVGLVLGALVVAIDPGREELRDFLLQRHRREAALGPGACYAEPVGARRHGGWDAVRATRLRGGRDSRAGRQDDDGQNGQDGKRQQERAPGHAHRASG